MLILMKNGATAEEILRVKQKVQSLGFRAHEIPGAQRIAIGITGNQGKIDPDIFATMGGVEQAFLFPVRTSSWDGTRSRRIRKYGSATRVSGDRTGHYRRSLLR